MCPARLVVSYPACPLYDSKDFHSFSVHTWTHNFDIVKKSMWWCPQLGKNLRIITSMIKVKQGYSNHSVIPTIKLMCLHDTVEFSKGKTLLISVSRSAWFTEASDLFSGSRISLAWNTIRISCFALWSERLETFSIIILLIKTNNCCRRLWHFWFLSYTLWWLEWFSPAFIVTCDYWCLENSWFQEFRSHSKMTMLKSTIDANGSYVR